MQRPVPLPQAYSALSTAISVTVAATKPLPWRKSANARPSSECQHVRKAADLLLASKRLPQTSSLESSCYFLASSLHAAQKSRVSSPNTAATDQASRYSTQRPPRPHPPGRERLTQTTASWPEQHSAKTAPRIYVELKDQGHMTDSLVPYAGGKFSSHHE